MELEYTKFIVINSSRKFCRICGEHLIKDETTYQLLSVNADIKRFLGYHSCYSNHKNSTRPYFCSECWKKNKSRLEQMYCEGWSILEVN